MTNARGIDVSKWQSSTPNLTGLTFLFARASVGTTKDPVYPTHAINARRAGLILGAYHFGYEGNIAAQAATFLAAAPHADFYALDVEGQNAPSHAESKAFLSIVKQAGKRTVLYTSEAAFFNAGQDYNWVANWSREPNVPWHFWQTSGTHLDLDQFHGTAAQLRAIVNPPTHVLHIAHGAEVRHWANNPGCLAVAASRTRHWTGKPSQAGCGVLQSRSVCGTTKRTRVALVTGGVFAGRLVRISAADGVTYT